MTLSCLHFSLLFWSISCLMLILCLIKLLPDSGCYPFTKMEGIPNSHISWTGEINRLIVLIGFDLVVWLDSRWVNLVKYVWLKIQNEHTYIWFCSDNLQDDGLYDSSKIAAFDFDGCLANTDVKRYLCIWNDFAIINSVGFCGAMDWIYFIKIMLSNWCYCYYCHWL